MILATLVTSLGNILSPQKCQDPDLLDVTGSGDTKEMEIDDKLAEDEGNVESGISTTGSKKLQGRSGQKPTISNKQPRFCQPQVADSWEDEIADEATGGPVDDKSKVSNNRMAGENPLDAGDLADSTKTQSRQSLILVYRAFRMLQSEFDEKFKKMWA